MKNEITIWENGTKTRERKYYLTMFVWEAYWVTSIWQGEIFQILWPSSKKCVATQTIPSGSM